LALGSGPGLPIVSVMNGPTHYQVLDVAPTADQAAIRRAYHRAARRWHPDRRGELTPEEAGRAEGEIRRVNQAWEVLGRPERRQEYDRQLREGGVREAAPRPAGMRSDDGVIRIDPRLLDPEFLAARRHAQFDDISHTHSIVLRAAPLVLVFGLLAAIFVFTAYARGDGSVGDGPLDTVAGPELGAGVEANDCVSVMTGPALLPRPCDPGAEWRVIGARIDGVEGMPCPLGTTRDVLLPNGVHACLAPAR